jgi:predicted patatin/cPLA2 family phospholipase
MIARLSRKRELLRAGDPAHAEIRTALVVDGGSMRGVHTIGVLAALLELDMGDVFDYVIGVSVGAPICAYFVSNQPDMGQAIFFDDLVSPKFIKFSRIHKIIDLDYFENILRYDKPLKVERIREHRSKFLIGVTRVRDAHCVYLDMQDESIDVVTAIRATCALPIVYNRKVNINGEMYTDGTTACGLPVSFAVEQLGCSDVLLILNREPSPKEDKISVAERMLVQIVCRSFPAQFRKVHIERHTAYNNALASVLALSEEVGGHCVEMIVPGAGAIGHFTRDKAKLRAATEEARRQTLDLFLVGQPASPHLPDSLLEVDIERLSQITA